MRLKERIYRLLNEPAGTFTEYSDASRMVSWLCGKRTGHLVIQIVGTKGRVREMQVGDYDPSDLLKDLVATMHDLSQ